MTGSDLVTQCRVAQDAGMDFPDLWHEILRECPLVAGPPLQTMRDGHPQLEIRLVSGGFIAFDPASNAVMAG